MPDFDEMITELSIDPAKTACFTGHRPEKFPFDTSVRLFRDMITSVLYLHADEAIKAGYDTFLCGMQRGTDVFAGLAILRLKEIHPHIRLICISPYRSESAGRRGADKEDYLALIEGCDGFIALQEEYSQGCFLRRNRFMVDHSSLIIGAVADRKSGTGQTLSYAQKKGLRVEEIDLVAFARDYGLH